MLGAVDDRDPGRTLHHAKDAITADQDQKAAADQRTGAAHPHQDEDVILTDKDHILHPGQSPGPLLSPGLNLVHGLVLGQFPVQGPVHLMKERHLLKMVMKKTVKLNIKIKTMFEEDFFVERLHRSCTKPF